MNRQRNPQRRAAAHRARDLDEEKRRRDTENQRVACKRDPQRRAGAHRVRDLDEEKRRKDTENQRLARQRDPQRRAAANSTRDLAKRKSDPERYQEDLMFTVNRFIFATSIACSLKQF